MFIDEADSAEDLAWDDRYLVGHAAIDHTHAEFVELLGTLLRCTDDALPQQLDAVRTHLEAHFALEEGLMEEYQFPPRDCHADEHARVLASVREVQQEVAAGELGIARDLARALADWFPGHSTHLDSALAIWVVKKRTAGAPVVLRRFKRSASDAVS